MSRRKKTNDGAVSTQVAVNDAFSNPMYRLGYGSQAPLEAADYPLTRMTDNYALLNSMYRSEGVLQSIIDIIPSDMCREWFTLTGNIAPDDMDALEAAQRRISLKDQIKDGLKWGRLYGGAAGIILIKGQEDFSKPLNLETIMPDSFKGLLVLDRWSGIQPEGQLITDLNDPEFGLPEYYDIQAGDGTVIIARVHHSRIVRFTGNDLPYIERVAEMYWGESVIEPIYDDIVLYDSIMHNMGNLTFRANVDTMEVQNLDQLFSMTSVEQQKRFWNVMQAQSVAQSNFGVRLVNKGDQMSNTQYSFAGFNYVTEAAQLNLCAKTHIPMTKLFGRSPAGMNATGESDMKNYYDIVDGERETKLRPAIEKILPVLCMSVWGKIPEDMQVVFPPLWTPNATELAQIAKTKADTVIGTFQAGLIDMGTAQAELKKLSDETGMFDSIPDEDIESNKGKTFQDVTALQDPMAGLSKGSNEDSPFTSDANPNHDPKNGRFTFAPDKGSGSGSKIKGEKSKNDTTTSGNSGKMFIARTGEDFPVTELPGPVIDDKGRMLDIISDKVTDVYIFAGKDGRDALRVRDFLQKQYKGTRAKDWAHVAGNVVVQRKGKTKKVQVHWFQNPDVGICKVEVRNEVKKNVKGEN